VHFHSRRGFLSRMLGTGLAGASLLEPAAFVAARARAQSKEPLPTLGASVSVGSSGKNFIVNAKNLRVAPNRHESSSATNGIKSEHRASNASTSFGLEVRNLIDRGTRGPIPPPRTGFERRNKH
jgi:hypothetical protein